MLLRALTCLGDSFYYIGSEEMKVYAVEQLALYGCMEKLEEGVSYLTCTCEAEEAKERWNEVFETDNLLL